MHGERYYLLHQLIGHRKVFLVIPFVSIGLLPVEGDWVIDPVGDPKGAEVFRQTIPLSVGYAEGVLMEHMTVASFTDAIAPAHGAGHQYVFLPLEGFVVFSGSRAQC